MTKSIELKQRLEDAGVRYWAGDNISKYCKKVIKKNYRRTTEAFENVLETCIDIKNDPTVWIQADVLQKCI